MSTTPLLRLTPPVAHGDEEVDEPQGGEPPEHGALFDEQHLLPGPAGGEGGGQARHAASGDDHIIRFFPDRDPFLKNDAFHVMQTP